MVQNVFKSTISVLRISSQVMRSGRSERSDGESGSHGIGSGEEAMVNRYAAAR